MSQNPEPPSKPASPRRLDGFLRTGYLIHDVSRLRHLFYDPQSQPLGITRAQWWVLFNLSRHDGEPPNQNELAEMIEIGSAAVGELIQRLDKAGFVKRLVDPRDRRVKRVVIATRGREVLEHMRLVARESQASIMAGISFEEQEILNELLARMKRNLVALQSETPEDDESEDPSDLDTVPSPVTGSGSTPINGRKRLRDPGARLAEPSSGSE